jgi:hypothetical protein
VERKLLKILLLPNGVLKFSRTLSAKLGLPISTVRQRRKRLESIFLKIHYVLDKRNLAGNVLTFLSR